MYQSPDYTLRPDLEQLFTSLDVKNIHERNEEKFFYIAEKCDIKNDH